MKKYSSKILFFVLSVIVSALFSLFYEETVISFLINVIFFSLSQNGFAMLISKRKFKTLIFLAVLLPLSLVIVKDITNSEYKKIEISSNIAFYYEDEEDLVIIKEIENKMDDYSRISSEIFDDTDISNDKVKVYFKGPKESEKDKKLRTFVGYYSDGVIVVGTGKIQSIYYAEKDKADAEIIQTFFHEYTHHVNQSWTKNLPKWFDEGLALYMAARLSGDTERLVNAYVFNVLEDETNWNKYDLALIYHSSRYYIEQISENWGDESIKRILMNLANGDDFSMACEKAIDLGYKEIIKLLEGNDFR